MGDFVDKPCSDFTNCRELCLKKTYKQQIKQFVNRVGKSASSLFRGARDRFGPAGRTKEDVTADTSSDTPSSSLPQVQKTTFCGIFFYTVALKWRGDSVSESSFLQFIFSPIVFIVNFVIGLIGLVIWESIKFIPWLLWKILKFMAECMVGAAQWALFMEFM